MICFLLWVVSLVMCILANALFLGHYPLPNRDSIEDCVYYDVNYPFLEQRRRSRMMVTTGSWAFVYIFLVCIYIWNTFQPKYLHFRILSLLLLKHFIARWIKTYSFEQHLCKDYKIPILCLLSPPKTFTHVYFLIKKYFLVIPLVYPARLDRTYIFL